MKRVFILIAAGAAWLVGSPVRAAIPLNAVQTFDAVPPAVDWAMLSVAGASGTPNSVAALDAFVQTNTTSTITNVLVIAAGSPASVSGNVMWSSTRSNVISRPTGISYTLLLAQVRNTSGGVLSSIHISYDLIVEAPMGEESPGVAVYYSLSGDPSSWQAIADLSAGTDNTVGTYSKIASLNVGSWANNAILYLLFVDDNGSGSPDTALSIDKFLAATSIACPTITAQPANTTNVQNRTVTLSVVATGPGLVYQWSKVGGGAVIDGSTESGSTISGASTASLIISNAQTADTGDYFVGITNLCSGDPVTSTTAHLEINPDIQPPQFASARLGIDPLTFVVTLDEVLCTEETCGYEPTFFPFVWTVTDSVSVDRVLGDVTAAVIDGAKVTLTLEFPRTAGTTYKISVADSGPGFQVTDLAGNAMADGTFIFTTPMASFQQGDANGYAGTHDTEVRMNCPDDADAGSRDFFNVDASDITINPCNGTTAGPVQGLIRFGDIFGSGATQIPYGATIRWVGLRLNSAQANANGNPINMHRMLVPWSETTATWNTMSNGVDADDIEAKSTPDVANLDTALTVPFAITMDSDTYPALRDTVQGWANGVPNNGWVLLPTGSDGYRVDSSEALTVTSRPLLMIEYFAIIEHWPPFIVVQPPAVTTVLEGATAIIPVSVISVGFTTNQWKKNGVNVPGQTNETLRIVNVSPCDAGSYTLRVSNEDGFVETSAAFLVVNDDITRPVLTRAVSAGSTTIVLTFNKQLAATVTAISNYTLSGGATVSAAALSNGANNATVTLTTSARSTTTTLTITGLTDNRGCPSLINPNPTVVGITMVNIAAGAEWNTSWFYNTNNLDGTPTWKNTGFVLGADWLTGNALFGTEVDAATFALFPTPIATAIPPNTNTPPDFITAYFRKSVTLSALAGGATYVLEHLIDDGAVFYWDGVEFGRYNMTNGPVVYSTKAAKAIEASHQSIALPASANAGGTHTLAIEVHQGGATTSSDIVFGAQIVAVYGPAPSLSISHSGWNNIVRWTADSHWRLASSAAVSGPYTVVAGNPFQVFTVPPTANTNSAFFELQYNPKP